MKRGDIIERLDYSDSLHEKIENIEQKLDFVDFLCEKIENIEDVRKLSLLNFGKVAEPLIDEINEKILEAAKNGKRNVLISLQNSKNYFSGAELYVPEAFRKSGYQVSDSTYQGQFGQVLSETLIRW